MGCVGGDSTEDQVVEVEKGVCCDHGGRMVKVYRVPVWRGCDEVSKV